MLDYDTLDAGIREQVSILRNAGYNTTDSGDGSKWGKIDCAFAPHPHIIAKHVGSLESARIAALEGLDILGHGWDAEISYGIGDDFVMLIFQRPTEDK